jgi:hypothetical protein
MIQDKRLYQKFKSNIPWSDIILVLSLIPLRENSQNIDLKKFENQASKLYEKEFNKERWIPSTSYLLNHGCNSLFKKQNNLNNLSWFDIIKLLRNIIAHEKSLNWENVKTTINEIILFFKSRENFQKFLKLYENSKK